MIKRKSTKDKLRSTKHSHKTKDRVTRTPLKIGGNSDHLDIIPKTSVGIVISIIVIWTPFHKSSV